MKIVNLGVDADRIDQHGRVKEVAGNQPPKVAYAPGYEDAGVNQAAFAEQVNLKITGKIHAD
ncbi:MAG: hypothetical protein O7D97_00505, partial [Planctomycetota bacterium]|nr:hypothetical protein [Planctomycetota bacterium]